MSLVEKEMATHSSTLTWRIPWMEEPGRLWSMGSQRVRHNSDFTLTFHFHALEKEMATHSSVLAWRVPGTGEPGGLLSMGSHRVGQDWSDLAAAAAADILCSLFFSHFIYPGPNFLSYLIIEISPFTLALMLYPIVWLQDTRTLKQKYWSYF